MKILVSFFIVLSFFFPVSVGEAKKKRVVIIYNWSEYIPENVLKQFEKETGIRVIYSTYESNEAMFAKLKILEGKGYDIIVPSTYVISKLKNNNLLHPIDKSKLTNFANINPLLLGQSFDRKNEYSIPYMWGSTLLLVNKSKIDPTKITSWNDLKKKEFKGHVFLSDDLRDTMGIALRTLGFSPNTRDAKQIEQAAKWLEELMPSVRVFDITAQKQAFVSKEVLIGTVWSGDAFVAIEENSDLVPVYPKEGVSLWIDSFVIPKGAKNIDEAHEFINFLLRPEIAAQSVEEYFYSTPNIHAVQYLPPEIVKNSLINPPDKLIEKSAILDDVGDAIGIYEQSWEKIKVKNK
ncbi:MAG: ABC transporter substrate-binding protein [Desulfovibrionaceae bacterium]